MSRQPNPPHTLEAPSHPAGPSFPRQLLLLLLVLLPIALLIAWRVPVTYPEGDFVLNLLDAAKTGHVSSTFTPDTYPYLAGLAYRALGVRGFLLEQIAVYLLVGAAVLGLLRSIAAPSPDTPRPMLPGAVLLASILICLHPDLLSSIPKVWDTGLTSLLLLTFAAVCVLAQRRPTWPILLAIATLWGLGVSVRPNFALLLIPILYLLLTTRTPLWFLKAAAVTAWALIIFLLTNRLAHGAFYVAQNGPYNFFAGANPYTQHALLRLFNAESSVLPALAALGVHTNYQYDLALRPLYTHQALLFIRNHPLQWLWFGVIKLLTLLRANTKSHAALTPGWIVQVLTTLCVPIWLLTLAAIRKLEPADKLLLVLPAAYILPFLLTNSDPRFRPPLDLLVLTQAASLITRRLAALADRSNTRPPAREAVTK